MAAGLAKAGVGRGDVVGALLPMGPELIISIFASAQIGAVLLPLDPSLSGFEVGEIVGHCKSHVVVCESTAGETPDGAVAYSDLIETDLPDRPKYVQAAADPILLTASMVENEQVKAGILTHQNMLSTARNIVSHLKLTPDAQLDLSALPVGSMSLALVMSAFAAGVAVTFDAANATHAVTQTDHGWLEISRADHKFLIWGQSDTLAVLIAGDDHTFTALPGVEARVADDEASELQIRGPSVIAGYLANSKANAAAWTADGWYKTGTEVTVSDQSGDTITYSNIGGS